MHQATTTPGQSAAVQRVALAVDHGVLTFSRYWAPMLAAVVAPIVALPALAPILEASGRHRTADVIYFVYGFVCHQRPERSLHIHGEQMAFCARDLAITGTFLLALIIAAVLPVVRRVQPGSFIMASVASLPMAVDGFSQLFGLRESNLELRLLTGALFSLGWAWFAIPRLDVGFREVVATVQERTNSGVTSDQ
ncbi:MAG: hypothetical protein DCC58_07235 [Chloroflexi bacterium]|nr:MAG: hypothetical protein DCC58_07235 [Chloroflexota bacterium]